jgi:hypothetical protein
MVFPYLDASLKPSGSMLLLGIVSIVAGCVIQLILRLSINRS